MKPRIRRRRPPAPPPARVAQGPSLREAAKEGGLRVGGARDPAEHAARGLAGQVAGGEVAGGGPTLRRDAPAPRLAPGAGSAPAPAPARAALGDLGPGRALDGAERGWFEPRLGADLSAVRLHEGPRADRATAALGARAFAFGHEVALSSGARDRPTLAHELAHVVTEPGGVLHRDLALEPPHPGATATLTTLERQAAQRFNARRFEDPFTIAILRDVMGIAKYPAVIDDAFIDALVTWQAEHALTPDGQFGPLTTTSFLDELTAEGAGTLATLLRQDNSVRVTTTLAPAFATGPGGAAGTAFVGFDWDVAFNTSLRNGFLVQHIQSTWNAVPNPALSGTPAPRLNYWEAWPIGANGTSTFAKHPSGGDDKWRRAMDTGSRGTWSMAGTLYTVINLPAAFAVGNVPDAGGIRSALNLTAANIDALGLPEGFAAIEAGNETARRIGGTWDLTDPNPANHFHRQV